MERNIITTESCYSGQCVVIPTKHSKSQAIMQPFWEILGASVIEHVIDTDKLGTFSGEIERPGNAIEVAKLKCDWSSKILKHKARYMLSSEGSFKNHPFLHFLPCNYETLYFVDNSIGFKLHLSTFSEKTNYRTQQINSLDQLMSFAKESQFPSHGLIIKPIGKHDNSMIIKGIDNEDDLEKAFHKLTKTYKHEQIICETDMRAHMNPSRMLVINELAISLANRLKKRCPSCLAPGFGKIKAEQGLLCGGCGTATNMNKYEINGCVKCDYQVKQEREDGLKFAQPSHCIICNP